MRGPTHFSAKKRKTTPLLSRSEAHVQNLNTVNALWTLSSILHFSSMAKLSIMIVSTTALHVDCQCACLNVPRHLQHSLVCRQRWTGKNNEASYIIVRVSLVLKESAQEKFILRIDLRLVQRVRVHISVHVAGFPMCRSTIARKAKLRPSLQPKYSKPQVWCSNSDSAWPPRCSASCLFSYIKRSEPRLSSKIYKNCASLLYYSNHWHTSFIVPTLLI